MLIIGCRSGDACPFVHVSPQDAATSQNTATTTKPDAGATASTTSTTTDKPTPRQPAKPTRQADSSRIVQRPVASAATRDPRAYQISQLKTRFGTKEVPHPRDNYSSLTFDLHPSDPDFPFDIAGGLHCVMQVPDVLPRSKPSLKVNNKEIERGFQINIERGFDRIWAESSSPTLLNAVKALDRQLEAILTGKKADTIKIVVNRGVPTSSSESSIQPATKADLQPLASSAPASAPKPIAPLISSQRRDEARLKRQADVQTLKHRLSRDPIFSEAGNGTIFNVPIESRKRDSLPATLKALKSLRLYVPESYHIEPCTIELLGVDGEEAASVELAFLQRAEKVPEMSLMAHLNYLTQNIHTMAVEKAPALQAPPPASTRVEEQILQDETSKPSTSAAKALEDEDSHIHVIPRPLEWAQKQVLGQADDTASSSSYDTSDDDYSDDNHDEDPLFQTDQASTPVHEKGIMLSFPHLELYNIELLELSTLNLTVKCTRCRDSTDITNISPNTTGAHTAMRSASCKKCALPLAAGWRADLLHANSIRAGYLDLEGCTVVDLLPSHFTPTCATCSTPVATPGIVAVRGDAPISVCRECHKKLSFTLPEVRFLAVSNAHATAAQSLPRRKKETLGLVAGIELPNRGRCTHYRRSFRWFRFGCCGKVYPCDRCHDAVAGHLNEFANRMVCGMCSRCLLYTSPSPRD